MAGFLDHIYKVEFNRFYGGKFFSKGEYRYHLENHEYSDELMKNADKRDVVISHLKLDLRIPNDDKIVITKITELATIK